VAERTYVYRTTISRQQARHSMLGDLLERVFEGSPSLLVSSLVEPNHVTEDELREIRKLIAERKRQNE
jgi:predicted transcriptional regulator